jgi:hypothetical protein
MNITALYTKVQEYVSVATGLNSNKVIFSAQSSARPEKPFISIALTNFKQIGTPVKKVTDNDGIEKLSSSMTCTASFSSFCDDLHSAEIILHVLHHSFDTQLRNNIFKGEVAIHRTLKAVSAVPKILNEQIESQAILDVELSFVITHEQNISRIASVEITDEIKNKIFLVNE